MSFLPLELWDWCACYRVPFIYASSAQVYGDGSSGFDDDQTAAAMAGLSAITPYGASKLLFDLLVARERDAGRSTPPQWTGLRFFNVYGPREGHKGVMRSVIAKTLPDLLAGRPLRLFRSKRPDYADGGQMRDFICVRDCVDVVCWLLENPGVNGIFNLGTGKARTWLDLGHAMFAALARPANITFIDMPVELEGRYQYFTEARMERLRVVGYDRPFTPLEEGVADYLNNHLVPRDEKPSGRTAMTRPDPAGAMRIACVGGGYIGAGWAAAFLAAGRDVAMSDPAPDGEASARQDHRSGLALP